MKRYEPKVLQTAQHDAWAEMVKDPDGEWVRAEELEELRAERELLLTALDVIAKMHENYEDEYAVYRSQLLYSARCVARTAINEAESKDAK